MMITSGLVRPHPTSDRSRVLTGVGNVLLLVVLTLSILGYHANATSQETAAASDDAAVTETQPAS